LTTQFSQDLSTHTPVSFGGSYLYQQYEAVQRFLRHNFSPDFHQLLLKPVKKANHIEFLSEGHARYRELSELRPEEKEQVLQKYNALLYEIGIFRQRLLNQQSEDSFHWNALLEKIFDPSGHRILSDGNQPTLVWGWQLNLHQNHLLPLAAFSHLLPKEETGPSPNEEDEQPATGENEPVPGEEEIPEVLPPEPVVIPEVEPEIPLNEPETEPPLPESEEALPVQDSPPPRDRRKNLFIPFSNAFTRFLDACENLARRHPWLMILLLLLLLGLAYYLYMKPTWFTRFSGRATEEEIRQEYSQIMPPAPRVRKRPVRREDRIRDEESRSEIVGNVVNIALKKKTDDFRQFAVELKRAFPDSSYEIVYFDDETRRLQLAFPMEKRIGIKEEIRNEMNSYELLIWDEAIFTRVKTFNDPSFRDPEKSGPWAAADLPAAWEISTGDTSVIVAVIDDGFDLNHEEFRGRIVKVYNVVSHDDRVFGDASRFHGTHVGGIIGAAGNNSRGMSGVAPSCRLMPIQAAAAEGQFLMTDVVDGILYAIKNNADVINLSLGMAFGEEIKQLSTSQQQELAASIGVDAAQFWDELFEMAERNKVTIVAAAGNQNIMVGLDPMQRSEKVIKVAAADNEGRKAPFSNFFPAIPASGCCVTAPGVKIYSTIPGGKYDFMDGTSMAAPMVSGIVALLKSKKPGISNSEIMKILSESGSRPANPSMGPFVKAAAALRKAGF
jgi:hypothetical protein